MGRTYEMKSEAIDQSITREGKTNEKNMTRKVHVVINPASGQPQTILNKLNDVFHPAGVEWAVSIT